MFRKKPPSPRRRPSGRDADGAITRRPSVFSYRANRSVVADNLGRGEPKPEAVRRGLGAKTRFKRMAKIVVVVAIAIFVGNNLLLNRTPHVILLDAGSVYRDPAAYQQVANAAFAASGLNTNKITLNQREIRESLMQNFPELADVSISLPVLGHRPTVYLEPSTSRLLVRTLAGDVFVLDETGRAVASGSVVDRLKEAGLPEVKDESQLEVRMGGAVLPRTTVAFITEVAHQLKVKGMVVESLTLTNTPSELHLRVKEVGYYIKLNTRGDARVAVGSFFALKEYLEGQQKKPAEYVDVRIENRAYYK